MTPPCPSDFNFSTGGGGPSSALLPLAALQVQVCGGAPVRVCRATRGPRKQSRNGTRDRYITRSDRRAQGAATHLHAQSNGPASSCLFRPGLLLHEGCVGIRPAPVLL